MPACSITCHVHLFATLWTQTSRCLSVHGILQARILEWIVMPFSKGSSRPGDRTCDSCISYVAGRFFTHWVTWEAPRSDSNERNCLSGMPFLAGMCGISQAHGRQLTWSWPSALEHRTAQQNRHRNYNIRRIPSKRFSHVLGDPKPLYFFFFFFNLFFNWGKTALQHCVGFYIS